MSLAKFLIRLILVLAIPIGVGAGTFLFLDQAFFKPMDPENADKVVVEIAAGKTLHAICEELQSRGLLRYPWSLTILARIKKVDDRIKAGEYELSRNMTPRMILDKFISGEVLKRRLTLREGQSIWDLGGMLEAAGIIAAKDFSPALTDAALLTRAGIGGAKSFEGYLFPETYLFSRPITSAEIVWRMLEESERHWAKEYNERLEALKMTRHDILTLASIIEKETGSLDEQPFVSAVFHNRLAQGMKLQADPTVIYGIPNFDGNLRKDDLLNAANPYNTYAHFGLPPGPICNPGENAVRAALYPAQTSFLFFVADNNGHHVFASTLQEHNENVATFQKARAAAAQAAPAKENGVK